MEWEFTEAEYIEHSLQSSLQIFTTGIKKGQ